MTVQTTIFYSLFKSAGCANPQHTYLHKRENLGGSSREEINAGRKIYDICSLTSEGENCEQKYFPPDSECKYGVRNLKIDGEQNRE